jgi:hypothetical protein
MALFANSQATFTYNSLVNAEDVSDVIANIAPMDTPFLSALKKTKASSTKHEFITDDLTAAANNAQLESDVFAAGTRPTPVRLFNRTQIASKVVAVSRTQQASSPYGMKNMLAYQMANMSKELKRDMETGLTQNTTSNAGNTTTARQARGLEGWCLTNVDAHTGYVTGAYLTDPGTAPTDGTQRAFTEALLKTALQSAYTQGGNPTLCMVSPAAKQTFSTFTGNSTRFKDANETLNASISVYSGDFGVLKIVPNRFQRARSVFLLDMDYWALAEMTAPSMQDLPNTFDGVGKVIITEYTLESKQEKASAMVRDIL